MNKLLKRVCYICLAIVLVIINISIVEAETMNGVGTINNGTIWNTGNNTYSSSDLSNMSNYSLVGGDSNTGISGSWFSLINNTKTTSSLALFNGAMDMTKSVSLSGMIRATTHSPLGGISWKAAGDSLGYILTPISISDIKKNLPNSTNEGLGIKGLPNSLFLGRDFYSNLDGVDGPSQNGWISGASNVVAIRKTDGAGALLVAPYASGNQVTTTTGSAWQATPDSASISNVLSGYQQISEKIILEWVPDLSNTASAPGYISGSLKLILYDTAGKTIIANLTTYTSLYKTMSIGVVASTGEQYGDLSFSNNGTSTGGRGQSDVTVNYYKTGTSSSVSNWSSSVIQANVFDTIGILPPGNSANSNVSIPSGTYNFVAPNAPLGYLFNSISSPISVQNHDSSNNPNQINIYYTPQQQKVGFNYSYDSTAQRTPLAPSPLTFSGVTDQLLNEANMNLQLNLIGQTPLGYYISKVLLPNGKIITGNTSEKTILSFISLNPKIDATSNNNQYGVVFSPLTQTGTISFMYDTSVPAGAPVLPTNISLSGLTGADLKFSIPSLPEGYQISKVIGPDNHSYSSVEEALTANDHFIAGLNNFKIVISGVQQSGTINYTWGSDVPGYNGLDGKLQAKLPSSGTLSGQTGEILKFTPTIPNGYGISAVVAPDGKTYTDSTTLGMNALEAALNANSKFINGPNNFTIILKALVQNVMLNIDDNHPSNPTPPKNPGDQVIVSALTGMPISAEAVSSMQNWLNKWLENNAIGWTIREYVDPNGKSYTDSKKSLAEAISGAGGFVLADNNTYVVNIEYNGSISFSSVPTTINFGNHDIVASEQKYSGVLDAPVTVSDTRSVGLSTPWSISISQLSPIQEVVQNGVDSSGNPIYKPVIGGVSFKNYLSYNGIILTNTPQVIFSESNPTPGITTVIDRNMISRFSMVVPPTFQKANAIYRGELSWTLTIDP